MRLRIVVETCRDMAATRGKLDRVGPTASSSYGPSGGAARSMVRRSLDVEYVGIVALEAADAHVESNHLRTSISMTDVDSDDAV